MNSEAGQLRIPEEPVSSYLEYIEQGEGTWAVTTDGAHGGKKKHTSSENIETASLDVDAESAAQEAAQLKLDSPQETEIKISQDNSVIDQVLEEIDSYRER